MLKNELGSTILQVLLATGLVGGAALFLAKTSELNNKVQSKYKFDQDLMEVTDQIQTILGRTSNCWVTINRIPKDGIYIGEAQFKDNYFQNFTTTKAIFKVGQVVGNSGILLKDIQLIIGDDAADYLDVSFQIRDGTKLVGASEVNKKFKIKYSYNQLGAIDSCYSEVEDDIANAVKVSCLNLGAEYTSEKCNWQVNIPTCVLSSVPCEGAWIESSSKNLFLTEIGTNPDYEPKSSFAEASYKGTNLRTCCRQDYPSDGMIK